MKMRVVSSVVYIAMFSTIIAFAVGKCEAAISVTSNVPSGSRVLYLSSGWQIQSSQIVTSAGNIISTESFIPEKWHKAIVPSTILGTLVADSVFRNPFQGRNLSKIPESLFDVPWWYRTTFSLPNKAAGFDHLTLKFLGIIYKANIWLNGKLIADSNSVFGAFRQFEFDVTNNVKFGGVNVLAVEVFKPGPGALTLGFVDWNPKPPDRNMGLWRPVELHITGDVSIENPFVASKVDTATLKEASLTVSAELVNKTKHDVNGELSGRIGNIVFSQKVSLSSFEKKQIVFSPASFSQLEITNPRLWWTHDFGKPNLYEIHLEFRKDGVPHGKGVTDFTNFKFGIRQINDYINKEGFRGYKLNGKKILIRGGGWADHIFLDQDKVNLEAQIDYAVNMHLNTIRMEGFWGESSDIFNLCDEKGILMMIGISCQWEWKNLLGGNTEDEYGCIASPKDIKTAAESFEDEIKWLRNHPSIFVWLYGSDKNPRPALEKEYQNILSRYDTTRPFLCSAGDRTSMITGPSGVKMRGPYDYEPPVYWFVDTLFGGAFGFNTETGPGPQVPLLSSLKKMLDPDSLWPINGEWYYHSSIGEYRGLPKYDSAIVERLGKPADLYDYERKAQFTNYEAMRAMFEAFGAKKFKSTGVIQWMYNAAWPKVWWQLYDYYLNPTGAFYGAEKACEPIHVEYNPADHGIVVVNSTLQPCNNLTLKSNLMDFTLKKIFSKEKQIDIPANASNEVLICPDIDSSTPTYFLSLRLYSRDSLVSSNFYALSTTPDSIHEKKTTWHDTRSSYANLTELNTLPEVKLETKHEFIKEGKDFLVKAAVRNPTNKLAFMVYLSVKQGNTETAVLPIFWDENYVTLLPGETRTIVGRFHAVDLHGSLPRLEITGWNVK